MDASLTQAPALRRRVLFENPGESLLLPASPVDLMVRFDGFAELTGFPGDDLQLSPLAAIPLPPLRGGTLNKPVPRAEAMWHPMMWLPPRLVTLRVAGDQIEPIDVWAVRLMLELQESGLYDQETGTWLDVLSLVGLDVDDPDDNRRVQRWLDGYVDPDLDAIDLEDFLRIPDDPDWAAVVTAEVVKDLLAVAWARSARGFIAMLRDALDSTDAAGLGLADDPELSDSMLLWAAVGAQAMLRQPAYQLGVALDDLVTAVHGCTDPSIEHGPVHDLIEALQQIVDQFGDVEEAYLREQAEQPDEPPVRFTDADPIPPSDNPIAPGFVSPPQINVG